jgi:hypothetical protein
MLNEMALKTTGLFLVIVMLATLVRYMISVQRFRSCFKKMKNIVSIKNIPIDSKTKTISGIEKMHEIINSKESETILAEAKVVYLDVNRNFRIFVIVSIVAVVHLAIWKLLST